MSRFGKIEINAPINILILLLLIIYCDGHAQVKSNDQVDSMARTVIVAFEQWDIETSAAAKPGTCGRSPGH